MFLICAVLLPLSTILASMATSFFQLLMALAALGFANSVTVSTVRTRRTRSRDAFHNTLTQTSSYSLLLTSPLFINDPKLLLSSGALVAL